jgi:teichuronic acid biosynthesis glycosyltransferase TuaC
MHPVNGHFHRRQAEALARCGVEVEVVAPIPWVPPGMEHLSATWRRYKVTLREYTMGGCRILRPRYVQWPRGDVWGWSHQAIKRAVQRCVKQRPDVIHAHFAYPCGLAGAGLARRWSIPCVLTLHGSDVNRYPFINTLTRRRFRFAVSSADCVLAVSHALAERTAQLTGRRPLVKPNGIDLRLYEQLPGRKAARERLGLPLEKPVVLFVGHLLPAKGVCELLKALHTPVLKEVLGVFVGEGPLRAEVQRGPNTRAEGPQPNERIPLYLAAADLFVLPSHSEGMPNVLVEAGAAGVPVIATTVGGIPELLAEDRGRLIPPHQLEELVCAIREVLEDPEEARGRAERLRRYVWEHYDVDLKARELVEIYGELL